MEAETITPEVQETGTGRIHFTDDTLLKVLRACGGYRSVAARQLGVTPSCIRMRLLRNPKLREAIEDAEIEMVDLAQNELAKKLKAGDLTAIIFTLKCKGGWCETNKLQLTADAEDAPPIRFVLPSREAIEAAKETKRLIAESTEDLKSK